MRRAICLALAAVLLLSAGGCVSDQGGKITVYLLRPVDDSEPVGSIQVSSVDGVSDEETAMRALIHPPKTPENLFSPYPEGVELVSITRSGALITVELNEEYLNMRGVALAQAEGCAALTLCELEGVGGVRFLVDGKPHPDSSEEIILTGSVVGYEIGSASLERELTLYFRSAESGRLSTETRGIVMREGELVERYVVEELIKGPNGDGLRSMLPSDLELREVTVEGGVCTLSLSREFEQITKGTVSEELNTLISVGNSIIVSSSASAVRFLVEGEPLYSGEPIYQCEGADNALSYAEFEVWLPSNDGQHVEPARIALRTDSGLTSDRLLINCLVNGPDGSGFFSPIPRGTKILKMNCSSAYCYIDFSQELLENISEDRPLDMALKCLAHTLRRSGYGLRGVEVSVDGVDLQTISADTEDIHPDFR